jgi:heat shock protein HslJ
MRTGSLLFALLALLAAAMLLSAGCTSTPPTNQTNTTATTPAGNATTVMPTTNVTGNVTPNGTVTIPTFTNTTWQWNALEVGANKTVINNSASYTVVFRPNGTYALKADCNNGAGNYTVNGTALNLSPAAVTLAYCGEASKDQLYLTSLMRATSYTIDRTGNLILALEQPNNRMVFSAANATANVSAPFVGANWRWVGTSGSSTVTVPNPNQYTIAFNATGTYAVKADCNVGSGNYTLDGTKLRINQGALTKAYCGDASLDRTYLASLNRVTSYVMDSQDRLVLIMISPNERLLFEKIK